MCRWSIWCTLFGGSVTGWCNMITYRVFLIRKHTPTQCISFDCCLFRQPPRKKNIPKWWLRMSRFQQIYTLLTCKHTTLAVKRDPNTSQPPLCRRREKSCKKNGTLCPSEQNGGSFPELSQQFVLVRLWPMGSLMVFHQLIVWLDLQHLPWITNYHYKKVNAPSQIACFKKTFVGTTCWILDISLWRIIYKHELIIFKSCRKPMWFYMCSDPLMKTSQTKTPHQKLTKNWHVKPSFGFAPFGFSQP